MLDPEEGSSPVTPAVEPAEPALPEFLNPESVHYQPWAEKQISNATKDKRPLGEFMAELEGRLEVCGQLPDPRWDPQRQERLLARFATPVPGRSKRRRRRRPGSSAASPLPKPAEARTQPQQPGQSSRRRHKPTAVTAPVAGRPTATTGEAGSAPKRRRRRRRSRSGAGGAAAPPTA